MDRINTRSVCILVAAALWGCDTVTGANVDAGALSTFDASVLGYDSGYAPWDGGFGVFDAAAGDGGRRDDGGGHAGAGDAGPGAAGDASGSHTFSACTAALKPKCGAIEKDTACSSIVTQIVPTKDGGTAGGVEVPMGPYGAYIAWNQGKGFENPENILEGTCDGVASSFGEPASVTADVLDLRGQDLTLYTVARPACMQEGEKYPVITWGNGTCGQSGGYAALLAGVASQGFVVFAANSRWTDGGNNEMLKALDFAKAANADPSSVYYQKLDLDHIGAMGHSQGSSAAAHAANDPRVKAAILWNAGSSATKPFLAVSGDRDIGNGTVSALSDGVNAAAQPGAWLYFHKVLETGGNFTGHLTLMMQPERVLPTAVAWWKYMLKGDADAKKLFLGPSCGLCSSKTEFEFGANTKLM